RKRETCGGLGFWSASSDRLDCEPRLLQLTKPLIRVRHVDENCSRPRRRNSCALKCSCCIVPSILTQCDQTEIEGRRSVSRPELSDPAEFPCSIAVHARLVERDAEIAMLVDCRVRRDCGRCVGSRTNGNKKSA